MDTRLLAERLTMSNHDQLLLHSYNKLKMMYDSPPLQPSLQARLSQADRARHYQDTIALEMALRAMHVNNAGPRPSFVHEHMAPPPVAPPAHLVQERLLANALAQQQSVPAPSLGAAVFPPGGPRAQLTSSPARMSPEPPKKRQKKGRNFPMKLMEALLLLEQDEAHQADPVFAWLHDGQTFTVLKEDAFCEMILQAHGVMGGKAQYGSFVRKMNR